MERLREGYKQTELGVIPEDWEIISISTIGNTYTGLSGKKAMDFGSGEARYIPFLNILKNPYIDITSLESVSIGNDELQNKVRFGDLFFNTSSETPDEVGMCSVLLNNIPNLYLNSFCFGFRLFQPNRVNGLFLSYYFRNKQGRELMNQLAQGSTRYNLAKANFLQAKIGLPSQKEQKAISEVLNDIDSLIEALGEKIAKKRAIKEGAMQQLLTGKKRLNGFNEPWKETSLGEISEIHKGQGLSKSKLVYDGKYPCILYGELFTIYSERITHIVSKTNSEQGVYSVKGDILLPGSTTTIGIDLARASALLLDNVLLGGDINVIRLKDDKCNPVLLAYILTHCKMQDISLRAKGITVYHLHGKDMIDLKISLPESTDEQAAIVQIITDMDDEIRQLENERQKYVALKQGAMQQLLTGQIRLTGAIAQSKKAVEFRTIPIAAHTIAAHIVNQLYQSKGWGRTKFQKALHLVGYHCKLDLGNEYKRNVAGPDDRFLLNYIDLKFKQYRQVDIKEEIGANGRVRYTYTPTAKITEAEQAFERYAPDIKNGINVLLDKIKTMDLARAEIVSTLYAVWNNRIIKKQPITDDSLLADFYAWSKHKSDFAQEFVLRALNWMRTENITPVGWGKYIDKK